MRYPICFVIVDAEIPENAMQQVYGIKAIFDSATSIVGGQSKFTDEHKLALLCDIDSELMNTDKTGVPIFCGSHISETLVSCIQKWHPRAYYIESEELWDQIELCNNVFSEMSVVKINISHALEGYATVKGMVEHLWHEALPEDKYYEYGLEYILKHSRSNAEDRARQWLKDALIMKTL